MLKKALYVTLLLIFPIFSFGDDNVQQLFKQANTYYSKADYKDAEAAYQKVIDAGYQSAALYFNMGNACYKNDDLPSALLYYGKAHRLAPGDEHINFNIRYVSQKTVDKVDEPEEFFLSKWWHGFILSGSLSLLATLSIAFGILASAILILYFFANSVAAKKTSFFVSLILFALCAFTVFVGVSQVNYFNSHKEAIVFSNSVSVKNGPVEKAAILFVIHEGTKISVLDDNSGWLKIRLANGNEGWIRSADVKEI